MPENQKEKKDGTVAEDQKERGYYYDDAHGYEEYVPDEDDECAEPADDVDGSGRCLSTLTNPRQPHSQVRKGGSPP